MNKGIGIICSVTSLLKNISLGKHYFKIGLLFRETNVINGITSCIEVTHGITKQQVKKLENIDEIYLRKLLGAPITTAKEALYIETGKIPLSIILKMRRLLYWWNLVNQNKNSMLYKVYTAQTNKPVKGDWVNLLKEDKKNFP